MRPVEGYLDKVMAAARLAPGDARRVRGELQEHLLTLVESGVAEGLSEEEAWTMVRNEFGEPAALGEGIARAKGRLLTWMKKRSSRVLVSVAVVLLLTLTVRSYAVSLYRVAGASVEPYAVKGSHILVNRLVSTYQPEDLVVYRTDGVTLVGVVKSAEGQDAYVIAKPNRHTSAVVKREAIVGRVFMQTR